MLKTCEYHSFIQRPHFSQIAKNDFRATFFTPADNAAYLMSGHTEHPESRDEDILTILDKSVQLPFA